MRSLITLSTAFFITVSPLAAQAMRAFDPNEVETFDHSEAVPDSELAKMRGGFITPGGLMIDFAITTRTLVDGAKVSDITMTAQDLQNLSSSQDLQKLIQIGGGNSVELNELANNPNVGVVIQNSLDEKVIQQFSILDVTVQNFEQFQANKPLDNALLAARTNPLQ